jgi:hypothetical protein
MSVAMTDANRARRRDAGLRMSGSPHAGRRRAGRGLRVAGALALLGLAALALFAAPAQAAKKPDLVIAGYAVHGQRYAFEDERGKIIPHDVTRNKGSARAGPSITRAYLVHGAGSNISEIELARRAVPALGPQKQSAGDAWDPTHIYNYPIGPYVVDLCADNKNQVPESDETNNCALIRNSAGETVKVYIVRRTWVGTIGGYAQRGAFLETYSSTKAKLIWDKPIDATDGWFAYDFAGPVTYKDSGSTGICTWSGGDTQTFGPGGATAQDDVYFDYLTRRYGGGASVDGDFYSTHLDCGSSHTTSPGPAADNFLNLGDSTSFPFGAKHISGSISSSGVAWTWGFD